MKIDVLFFGMLREMIGRQSERIDMPEGAQVKDVLSRYVSRFPGLDGILASLAIAVNQEYSGVERTLHEGDEIGLLPPVSGGLPEGHTLKKDQTVEVRIVRESIKAEAIVARQKRGEDGAIVVFDGIARNNTRGRRTLYLDYEAYEPMAWKQLETLGEEAAARFAVRSISILHRLGRLEVGETSVLIVVASAHRAAAFEACRWIIDTLKKTVPIWKKEFFEDGAVWADGEPFPEEIRRPAGAGECRRHPTD